jgi:regulation of enolase protein 1 (concanavalin A-like superfamily)
MRRFIPTLVAVIGVVQLAAATAHGQPIARVAARELGRWGAGTDPDGDCTFFVAKKSLLISVPGSGGPHDLAAEIDTANAPRVLRPVCGDFTIQVRVDGRFAPGMDSSKPGRVPYNGAGLVAMMDSENVVTLARAALQRKDGDPESYANFEIRTGGQLQRIGVTGDQRLPKDGPVFLRLERRSSQFHGAVSEDGSSWRALEPKEIPSDWPKDLQAGVIAISTSKDEFNPRFSQLQVLR